jgi:hypothetical protein
LENFVELKSGQANMERLKNIFHRDVNWLFLFKLLFYVFFLLILLFEIIKSKNIVITIINFILFSIKIFITRFIITACR